MQRREIYSDRLCEWMGENKTRGYKKVIGLLEGQQWMQMVSDEYT